MISENDIADIRSGLTRPVVLVGMMGAGKSHVGRALAHALDWPFYDSDSVVEQKAGYSISEIFEKFGEQKFRESERNTILEIMKSKACVLATGGGAVTNPDVLAEIMGKGHVIWLQADTDMILQRVGDRKDRPLLRSGNPRKTLQDLLQKRQPFYEQAHVHVKTTNSPDETFGLVIKSLSEHLKPSRV